MALRKTKTITSPAHYQDHWITAPIGTRRIGIPNPPPPPQYLGHEIKPHKDPVAAQACAPRILSTAAGVYARPPRPSTTSEYGPQMNGHGKKSVGQSTSPHRDPPRCSRGSLHRRWLPAARRYGWRRRRGGTGGRAGGEREERRRRHVVGETDSSEEEDRHVNLFCATPQIPGHIPGPRARCLCGLW